jgi:hypothetical protein
MPTILSTGDDECRGSEPCIDGRIKMYETQKVYDPGVENIFMKEGLPIITKEIYADIKAMDGNGLPWILCALGR